MVSSTSLSWSLPGGGFLDFVGNSNMIGTPVNSQDMAYSATLTNRSNDPISPTRFFYTSSLHVLKSVSNGSTIACSGGGGTKNSTEILLSGEFLNSISCQ